MSMIAVCDGCGKQEPAACIGGHWYKPALWYERTPLDKDRNQLRNLTACSRACIEKVAEKERAEGGEGFNVVLPI